MLIVAGRKHARSRGVASRAARSINKLAATVVGTKFCGETTDGPFFEATYPCCCCTSESKGRWFFGE